MTYHYADGTIVECFVGLGVEEGVLQDARREAYLIGGWVVIGVDGLWVHKPLIAVNGFAGLLGDMLVVGKGATSHHVVIVAL